MKLKSKINDLAAAIHSTDIYGTFIEVGCGVAAVNSLMEVAGATKTIYSAESPYSKEFQQQNYPSGSRKLRAVSQENVSNILRVWDARTQHLHQIPDTESITSTFNSIYVASFQLGDETGSVATHGWIAFMYKSTVRFYHISIHEPMTRAEYLERIAFCGLSIIFSRNRYVPHDAHVDMVDGFDDNFVEMCNMLNTSNDNNILCIRNNQFVRIEDFFRDTDNILIFKGSFNPIHLGHIDIANAMESAYKAKPVLMISTEIYGKSSLTPDDIKSRVDDLMSLGYDVIISKSGFFNDNIKAIRKKFKQPIIFGMGTDTLVRIFQSTYKVLNEDLLANTRISVIANAAEFSSDFESTKLFIAKRSGHHIPEILTDTPEIMDHLVISEINHSSVSSTQIRNGENLHMVPEKLRNKYKNTQDK